ncbi:MAG: hypothetical protein WC485_09140 [Opitutaceae bacterium]
MPPKPDIDKLSAAQRRRLGAMQQASAEGGAERTPPAVVEGMVPDELRVGQVVLQPVTIGHYLALEKIASPILELGKKPGPKVGLIDLARAAYILSLPAEQAMKAAGSPAFEDGVAEFCGRVPAAVIGELGRKIVAHLNAAFAPLAGERAGGNQDGPFRSSQAAAAGSGGC